MIAYTRVFDLRAADFIDVLHRSGLAERRPVEDADRIARMLANSNLIVTATDSAANKLIGVARSITDFAYCCYLSDLAVDRTYQGQGIGTALIEKTREVAGSESMCLLLSAPKAVGFYRAIGMEQPDNAFLYPRTR